VRLLRCAPLVAKSSTDSEHSLKRLPTDPGSAASIVRFRKVFFTYIAETLKLPTAQAAWVPSQRKPDGFAADMCAV
jgi:hypothetical protein